jgi:putative nucleotidyltransferase with HDIG domain
MTPLQHGRHLVTRFFGVVTSSPLGPAAQDEVNRALTEQQATLFWSQAPIDQRHAYEVATRVRKKLGADSEAVKAALLHDVGKRHSNAGAIGRSLATVLDAMKLPLPGDWRRYRDHGVLGAVDLEQMGAGSLAVAFARGIVAEGDRIDPEVWTALIEADDA